LLTLSVIQRFVERIFPGFFGLSLSSSGIPWSFPFLAANPPFFSDLSRGVVGILSPTPSLNFFLGGMVQDKAVVFQIQSVLQDKSSVSVALALA
jgi:hypothetical protein